VTMAESVRSERVAWPVPLRSIVWPHNIERGLRVAATAAKRRRPAAEVNHPGLMEPSNEHRAIHSVVPGVGPGRPVRRAFVDRRNGYGAPSDGFEPSSPAPEAPKSLA